MNELLKNKIEQLKAAREYECWYLVKQPTEFSKLCYLVSVLKEYQEDRSEEVLSRYVENRVSQLQAQNADMEFSNNYRALRVAASFGLITMNGANYKDAKTTPTFHEISERCNNKFEDIETYRDIIDRQIEKMFLSSDVDEEKDGVRKDFRLYPIMLLYKVLIELGRTTGEYSVSLTEYKYLLATTKKFEDYLDTVLLIKMLRADKSAIPAFGQFSAKFDNRMLQALKQLSTLVVTNNSISINPERLDEVAKKIFVFENRADSFLKDNYLNFLGSTQALIEPDAPVSAIDDKREGRSLTCVGARNRVVYGTPGCGKSYYVQNKLLPELGVAAGDRIRTTFYQDYTNTDFVGQIMPKVHSDKSVSYDFNPGPFALALKKAIERPEKLVALIIEELNRGNAPSIFGDIFQLLDRDETGKSQYSITNVNLQDYLNSCFPENADIFNEIYIPSNLHIVATMNTSDQNVFILDTAFKRRWQFEKLRNTFAAEHEYKGYYVPGMPDITWQHLVEDINAFIVHNSNELSSEDKQLGVYFIDREMLCENAEDCSDAAKKNKFAYKLLEYLWDDVAKFSRADWFGAELKSLDDLIDAYLTKGKKVFADGIISE